MRFGFDPDAAGLFLSGIRENTIVLRDTRGMSEAQIIMHEYVHFLVRNHSGHKYPKWYDEGFAEYLSASDVNREYFDIGGAQEKRLKSMAYTGWVPMLKVISPEDYEEWGDRRQASFYTEAWALVHYLNNRPDREKPFSEDMQKYLNLIESGKDNVAAFEEAFEIPAEDINGEVRRYLKKGQYAYFRIKAEQLISSFSPKVTKISDQQISLALGHLALRQNKLDDAQHYYSVASEDELLLPRATAGLGDVWKFRGEYEKAQPYFEKAVAAAPNDPLCRIDFAEYWHDLSHKTEDTEQKVKFLNLAREQYLEAWKIDDSMPEIYAMYGQTFLNEGARYDKAIEMLEGAKNLLPSDLSIRLMLANAYAGANRIQDARETANSVLTWSHNESITAKQAQELLARLDAKPNRENDDQPVMQ